MSRIKVTNLRQDSATSDNISLDSSGNVAFQAGSASAPSLHFTGDTNTGIYAPAADSVAVVTGGSARTTVDSSGRLLVGTSTAQGNNRLQLEGSASGASEWAGISLRRGVATASLTSGQYLGAVSFQSQGGAEGGVIRAICHANWSASSHPTRLTFETTASSSTSPTERMRIEANGRTSVFTTDTDSFDVGNSNNTSTSRKTIRAYHSATAVQNGTEMFYVQNNGDVKNTNNSYGSISDQRLKENIVDAGSQWQDIKDLRVRKFNFRENTGHQTHTQIGLIAQEAETVSAGLVADIPVTSGEVVLDADGIQLESTKTVNYSVLYMKSVKALQEAMTRIETLETANASQAATIAALDARLTALEG